MRHGDRQGRFRGRGEIRQREEAVRGPIASFGAIREKIADGVVDIFRAESIVYRVAGLLDRRLASIEKGTPNYYGAYQKGIEEYAVECAIAKVCGSEAFCRIADEALQIHSG